MLSDSTRVSLVIPVYNNVELTTECVNSIAETLEHCSIGFEVVIVDNGSSDATPELCASLEGDVTVIRFEDNIGFGPACNAGAHASRGEYVVFVNNDVVTLPGWLEPMVAAMDEDDRRAAVQPKLLFPDGRLNDAGGLMFAKGEAWRYGMHHPFPDAPVFNVRRAPDYAGGACLMVRRSAFLEVGGFDERYAPVYYEDTDLSFAFREAGYTVLYEPSACVIHLEGGTSGTDISTGPKRYQPIHKQKFADKWATELATRPDADPAIIERWAHRPQGGLGPGEIAGVPAGLRVLFIDPFVPWVDRNAGAQRTLHMVKSLRRLGHSVTFYALNGMARDDYAPIFEREGVCFYGLDPNTAQVMGLAPEARALWAPTLGDLKVNYDFDVVIIDFWHTAEELIPGVRECWPNAKVIVDSVDVHFLRERRQAELVGDRNGVAAVAGTRKREVAVYKAADSVVATTPDDALVIRKEIGKTANVFVVPCGFTMPEPGLGYASRSDLLFVGNYNHTPNLDALKWWVEEIGPRLADVLPGVKLRVAGNDPGNRALDIVGAERGVEYVGWVQDLTPLLHGARVSVAPLRYGSGMKGKVGEALAFGIPTVITPMAAEGMGLVTGVQTLVADSAEGFVAAIVKLYHDEELWMSVREAGRAHVEANFGVRNIDAAMASIMGEASSPQTASLTLTPTRSAASAAAKRRKPTLGVVMNTYNEEDNLAGALDSAAGWDELVVADMFSTDATRAVAAEYGARVIDVEHSGFCESGRQIAIDSATTDWVLIVDGDERLSPGAMQQVRELIESAPISVSAYELPFPTFLGERRINASGWELHFELHPRLFRRADATWPPFVHSVATFTNTVSRLPAGSTIAVENHCFNNLEHAIAKFNRYSTIEAHDIVNSSRRPSIVRGLRSGIEEFLHRYNPEIDGDMSFALSYGLLTYKLLNETKAVELVGWDTTASSPSRDAVVGAFQAFWNVLASTEVPRLRALAEQLAQSDDLAGARQVLEDVLEAYGDEPGTLSDLGAIAFAEHRLTDAVDFCERALRIDPNNTDALHNLGEIRLALEANV